MSVFYYRIYKEIYLQQCPQITVKNCFRSRYWRTSEEATFNILMPTWTQVSCLVSHRVVATFPTISCLSRWWQNEDRTNVRASAALRRTIWMRLCPISQTSCNRKRMHTQDRVGQWWLSIRAMTFRWTRLLITRLAWSMIVIVGGIQYHACLDNRPQTQD